MYPWLAAPIACAFLVLPVTMMAQNVAPLQMQLRQFDPTFSEEQPASKTTARPTQPGVVKQPAPEEPEPTPPGLSSESPQSSSLPSTPPPIKAELTEQEPAPSPLQDFTPREQNAEPQEPSPPPRSSRRVRTLPPRRTVTSKAASSVPASQPPAAPVPVRVSTPPTPAPRTIQHSSASTSFSSARAATGMLLIHEETTPRGIGTWLLSPDAWRRERFGYSEPILPSRHIAALRLTPAVLSTNTLLALIVFLVVGTASSTWSNLIEDYRDGLNRFLRKIPLLGTLRGIGGESGWLKRWSALLATVILYALIEAYISPDFSLASVENLGMWLIAAVAILIVSYTKDIIRLLLAMRLRGQAYFLPHMSGLLLAAVCVVLSRTLRVDPGYMFGIPIGFYTFSRILEEREGQLEWAGIVIMLLGGVVALLLAPLMEPYGVLFDLLLLLQLLLLEGAFFELTPLTHVPGAAIRAWSTPLWIGTSLIAAFLVFQTILNPGSTIATLSASPPTLVTLAILGVFTILSFFAWGVLRLRELTEDEG